MVNRFVSSILQEKMKRSKLSDSKLSDRFLIILLFVVLTFVNCLFTALSGQTVEASKSAHI
jgi:hypothetical protein